MAKVNEILALMERWAPSEIRLDYDNVGLLIGDGETEVKKILVALDITPEVADEAEQLGAGLIVSHHPVIFQPLKTLTPDDYTAGIAVKLIKTGIAAICMHTNLDIAEGGVNDILAQTLGLNRVEKIPDGGYGVLRLGRLEPPMEPMDFVKHTSQALGCPVKYVAGRRKITRVAVCGGAGGNYEDFSYAVAADCDAYVSSEFRHFNLIRARSAGITLVDGGHFGTEHPVCREIKRRIEAEIPGVLVSLSSQDSAEGYYINA